MLIATADGALASACFFHAEAPDRIALIANMAREGLTRIEIAERMGMKYHAVVSACLRAGIKVRRKKCAWAEAPASKEERAKKFRDLYSKGYSLQQIGQMNGLTRERVRQIMTSVLGVTGKDGGPAVMAQKRRSAKDAARARRIQAQYGITVEEHDRITSLVSEMRSNGRGYYQTPFAAYRSQKRNAEFRDIRWELTFGEWWKIWEESGKWGERGRGRDKYCMCRIGDIGPYAPHNVYIETTSHNITLYYAARSGKFVSSEDRPASGVWKTRSGAFEARASGGKSLGVYRTVQQAIEARDLGEKTQHALIKHGAHLKDPLTGEIIKSQAALDVQRKRRGEPAVTRTPGGGGVVVKHVGGDCGAL